MPQALENQVVWQKAIELADAVYHCTRSFPSEERFDLASQLRRAGTSIPSNIAEGFGRVGTRDYVRFLGIARGSAYEVYTDLVIARKRGYAIDDEILERLDEVIRLLNRTINTLSAKYVKEPQEDYNMSDDVTDDTH